MLVVLGVIFGGGRDSVSNLISSDCEKPVKTQ